MFDFDGDEDPPFLREERYVNLDDVLELIESEHIRNAVNEVDYDDLRDSLLQKSFTLDVLKKSSR